MNSLERINLPTKLEVGRELKKREMTVEGLEHLEKGFAGERWVLDTFSEFGQKHWKILQNVWLDYQGVFECDFLVLTTVGMYTFEIKNYSGKFSFQNSTCLLNGKKISHNPIYQAQKAKVLIESLLQEKFPRMSVQGILLFIGEHHTVEIADRVDDLQILMRNELRNYIWAMERTERNLQGTGFDIDACAAWLEPFRTINPFGPEPIDLKTKEQLRRGICCSNCGRFDVDTKKSFVTCGCGMHEPKENAIVRTICEYGVIHFVQELKTADLFAFFNGQVSKSTLLKLLNKHFTKIGEHKASQYVNLRLPFACVQQQFRLEKSRRLELKEY